MPTILHLVSGREIAVDEAPNEVHATLSKDREHGEPFSMFTDPDDPERRVYVACPTVTHFVERAVDPHDRAVEGIP